MLTLAQMLILNLTLYSTFHLSASLYIVHHCLSAQNQLYNSLFLLFLSFFRPQAGAGRCIISQLCVTMERKSSIKCEYERSTEEGSGISVKAGKTIRSTTEAAGCIM